MSVISFRQSFHTGQRVWAKFVKQNKNNMLSEYYKECSRVGGWDWSQCRIEKVLEMSAEEYDAFSVSLMHSRPGFSEYGGSDSDSPYKPNRFFQFQSDEEKADWLAKRFLGVILVTAPGREPLAVDPEGYSYARYVGIGVRVSPPKVREPGNPVGRWLVNGRETAIVESVTPARSGAQNHVRLIMYDGEGKYVGRTYYSMRAGNSILPLRWEWAFSNPDYEKVSPGALATIIEECDALDAALKQLAEAEAAARRRKEEKVRAEFTSRKPEWAKAVVVAELRESDNDPMSDYYGSHQTRRVFLAWSKTDRDGFAEMRKAAASFPPTADLATGPKDYEHREKYSMGNGYYLAAECFDRDGWKVRKLSLVYPPYELEWEPKEAK